MRRETTNAIRAVLEEVLPPLVRDSRAMRWLFRRHWGPLVDDIEDFRARIPHITADEYHAIYQRLPRVHDETDNSAACLERIVAETRGKRVLDVGCGTGYLARFLKRRRPELELTGCDFIIEEATRSHHPEITFEQAAIEALPFADASFDTVICTHVLEHILDFRQALAELRRVTGDTLILVVPREREYRFTFNPHLHFFPYVHSFLRYLVPLPADHRIESVGRDIFYVERKETAPS